MANNIPAIRILPMSMVEFEGDTAEEVQSCFFLTELPFVKAGKYDYRTKALDAESGTVVLFQYDKKIIASAVFEGREAFEIPVGPYNGVLKFRIDSIRIFEPVGPQLLRKIWPKEFKGFGNAMVQLNAEFFPKFEQQLTGIQTSRIQTSLASWNDGFEKSVQASLQRDAQERKSRLEIAATVPNRITVIATVFERNPDVVAEVLNRAGGICEQCQQPAPFLRKSGGTPYLEVHHKQRLADGGEDTVENAVAICPNCHRQAHYG